jgi:hypothetical protein
VDEELGTAPRNEGSGGHGYPQVAELGPAQDLFEGQASGSPGHHIGEVGRRLCG